MPEVKDYFVCHAGADKDHLVRPIVHELEAAGISCWLDEAEVLPGDSLSSTIYAGMSAARFVLAILSPAFAARPWPEHELNTAFGRQANRRQVRVVPLTHGLNDAALATLIDRYPPLEDVYRLRWEDGARRVIGQLEARLGRQYADGREQYYDPKYFEPVWFRLVAASVNAGQNHDLRATWGQWEYNWSGVLPGGRGPLSFRHYKAKDSGDPWKLRVRVTPDAYVDFGTGAPTGTQRDTGPWSARRPG